MTCINFDARNVQKTPKRGTRTKRTILEEEEVRAVLGNASWDRQGRVGAENGSGWMAVGWLGLVAEEFTFAFSVEFMSCD